MEDMMKCGHKVWNNRPGFLIWLVILVLSGSLWSQEPDKENEKEVDIQAVALEMIGAIPYCALISLNTRGQPNARMMSPFAPEEGLVIWFGTNPKSRKVQEIRQNPKVTIYYADPSGDGYVSITGMAEIVNDPTEKIRHWKKEWEAFYSDREESYVLIKVTPKQVEVVSYKHHLTGDPETWEAPVFEFK